MGVFLPFFLHLQKLLNIYETERNVFSMIHWRYVSFQPGCYLIFIDLTRLCTDLRVNHRLFSSITLRISSMSSRIMRKITTMQTQEKINFQKEATSEKSQHITEVVRNIEFILLRSWVVRRKLKLDDCIRWT